MHFFDNTQRFRAGADLGLEENMQRVEIHLPSEVRQVLDRVENWMRVWGYSRQDLFAIKVALQEALSNAFRHGNRSDPSRHVRVSFRVTTDEVLIGVEDQGAGFDPARVADAVLDPSGELRGGWGLFLMRAYTTWLTFDPPGNRVILCRLRSEVVTAADLRLTVEGSR
jgi:serine/threonine-protein kinase RsbW